MNAEKSFCANVFRSSTNCFVCEKVFSSVKQNRVQATHLFLKGDDLGWGAPGLGDDLGWRGEAARDAQGCGGGAHSWDCLRGTLEPLLREHWPTKQTSSVIWSGESEGSSLGWRSPESALET